MDKFEIELNIFLIIFSIIFLIGLIIFFFKLEKLKNNNIYKQFLIIIFLSLIIILDIKKKLYADIYGISGVEMLLIILKFFSIYFILCFFVHFIKSSKEKKKKIAKITLIIFSIWIIFITTDFLRAKHQKLPIFASNFGGLITFQDGGTTIYFGLGYKIFKFNTTIYFPDSSNKYNWDNLYTLKRIYFTSWWTDFDKAIEKIKKEPAFFNSLYK